MNHGFLCVCLCVCVCVCVWRCIDVSRINLFSKINVLKNVKNSLKLDVR